MVYQPKDP